MGVESESESEGKKRNIIVIIQKKKVINSFSAVKGKYYVEGVYDFFCLKKKVKSRVYAEHSIPKKKHISYMDLFSGL